LPDEPATYDEQFALISSKKAVQAQIVALVHARNVSDNLTTGTRSKGRVADKPPHSDKVGESASGIWLRTMKLNGSRRIADDPSSRCKRAKQTDKVEYKKRMMVIARQLKATSLLSDACSTCEPTPRTLFEDELSECSSNRQYGPRGGVRENDHLRAQ
jgi:hypothetical protein